MNEARVFAGLFRWERGGPASDAGRVKHVRRLVLVELLGNRLAVLHARLCRRALNVLW